MKRGQGLPLNTIIIAIIVIVVLVVIILITTGQLNVFQNTAGSAQDFSCTEATGQYCSPTPCDQSDQDGDGSADGAGTGSCGLGLTCCKT